MINVLTDWPDDISLIKSALAPSSR